MLRSLVGSEMCIRDRMFGLGLVTLMSPPFIDPRTTGAATQFGQAAAFNGGSQATAPQPRPAAPVAKQPAVKETHAESRLKSAAARQRTPAPQEQQGAGNRPSTPVEVKEIANSPAPSISQQIAEKHLNQGAASEAQRSGKAVPVAATIAAAATAASVASAVQGGGQVAPELSLIHI